MADESHEMSIKVKKNKKINKINQCTTKPTISLVRSVKTQISLWFCGSDQSLGWLHVPSTASGLSKGDKWESLTYWVDIQAYLSLCRSHRSYCWFCGALAQMSSAAVVIGTLKASYSSKIDIFYPNKLIYSINTIIKCGIWQLVKFQSVSFFEQNKN